MGSVDAVTGAFGYSGGYIARRLLAAGRRVRTLTGSSGAGHPLRERIEVHPLDFERPDLFGRALEGVDVLYNTYWVRFSKAGFSQDRAVANTQALFAAARRAGVRRVVHTSITNPSLDSPYEYFRGKARLEEDLARTGLSRAILRPAVFFGGEDVLLNNIAWMLRRFPIFAVYRKGDYPIRPIHVDDFAALALDLGARTDDAVVDAVGPESFRYADLVRTLADAIGVRRPLVPVPRWLLLAAAGAIGRFARDVVLTGQEIDALADGLLGSSAPSTGRTDLRAWAREHGGELGLRYASELARRRLPPAAP